jgi:succinyl-CoA synthetase alpha subunit
MQTKWMLEYGTSIVGGVTPGKGGQEVHGVPVYDSVSEAVSETNADASVIFVPAPYVKGAAFEALDNGLNLLVIVTEFVPVHDSLAIRARAKKSGTWIIGPNCPGLLTPGVGKLGIMPGNLFRPGSIGLAGRSATLSYEVAGHITASGMGQSTAVGIGGDMATGVRFLDILRLFEADVQTEAVVMVGEIGGDSEEEAAAHISQMTKPVVAFIAGRAAPPEKRLGHAGAIIRGSEGTAEGKIESVRGAGVAIASSPAHIPALLAQVL